MSQTRTKKDKSSLNPPIPSLKIYGIYIGKVWKLEDERKTSYGIPGKEEKIFFLKIIEVMARGSK